MPTILIVEDDSSILENTKEFLELEGFDVITATNGEKGLEQIFRRVPDLIICDLFMPEIDGLELLGKLGKYPEYKTIPFIFFSAKTEKRDIQMGLEAGAADYVTKPFEPEELCLLLNGA